MASYTRGTDGRLNDILTILGTTKSSLWPFWESTGTLVSGIGAGDLTSAKTAGAAVALESEFAPFTMPGGTRSYHFNPTGDHHLAGIDHANYTFGTGAADDPFSVGAWIRPNAIVSNTIMGKYNVAGTLREWRLWIDASSKLSLELYDESADATEIASSMTALTAGQWVMVVAAYNGVEDDPGVRLYVNAEQVNDGFTTETGAYVAMEDTVTPLTIGCHGVTATPAGEFHGRMALPFITGRRIEASEIAQLYALTAPMVGVA